MSQIKVVTINILSDLAMWPERSRVLAKGLEDLQPDLVALQEVNIPKNNAAWLASQLGMANLYLSPKSGEAGKTEGLAIISRYPIEARGTLDLLTQNRVAQYVMLSVNRHPMIIANCHFFLQPGESPARLEQVARLLAWLEAIPGDPPIVVCGDFNSTPETQSIQRMKQKYVSAYDAVHGHEPDYTAPTPLRRSKLSLLWMLLRFFRYIRLKDIDLRWRGTIDYIFVNHHVNVVDCQLALNQPALDNPELYPSDHFGIVALLEIDE